MDEASKLEVLQRYYQQLGRLHLDSNFDAEWKEEVESNMSRLALELINRGCMDNVYTLNKIVQGRFSF